MAVVEHVNQYGLTEKLAAFGVTHPEAPSHKGGSMFMIEILQPSYHRQHAVLSPRPPAYPYRSRSGFHTIGQ